MHVLGHGSGRGCPYLRGEPGTGYSSRTRVQSKAHLEKRKEKDTSITPTSTQLEKKMAPSTISEPVDAVLPSSSATSSIKKPIKGTTRPCFGCDCGDEECDCCICVVMMEETRWADCHVEGMNYDNDSAGRGDFLCFWFYLSTDTMLTSTLI
ncbi:hypothetical protein VTN00DRAFT_5165 [Thermoascus crustaceus]|uniref:uncharacterized protein n=1 Tax=Thermoascus crustaceus TaxID=5088 RepID=UPI0037433AE7